MIDSLEERPDPARPAPQTAKPQGADRGHRTLHYHQRTLKAYNAVDFNDLILLPVKLFQDHPTSWKRWQNTASATCWWTNTRTPTPASTCW